MSTKIYVAYRMKDPTDLWPFMRDVIAEGGRRVRLEVNKLIRAIVADDELLKEHDAFEREPKDRFGAVYRSVEKRYRDQAGSAQRDMFDFDVRVVIRELDGELYLIPHCDMLLRRTLDFLKRDERLIDYSYWNNTDRPSKYSQRAWDYRGKMWDAIDASGWRNYLVIEVCTTASFYEVVPDPVSERYLKWAMREDRKRARKQAAAMAKLALTCSLPTGSRRRR